MRIEKYSFGIGDRFGKEGEAQLRAIQEINNLGIDVVPVWNKSNREHKIVKTTHAAVRHEADEAVASLGWKKEYYVDADHIQLDNVDEFIAFSNFFTIDVAHFIAKPSDDRTKQEFLKRYERYIGKLLIPGIDEVFTIDKSFLESIADNYCMAIQEVKKIYNYVVAKKGKDNFIPEVSMDETHQVQSPVELFFILAELKEQGVELQTIAPKFSGLFAKGVDYIGDVKKFAMEFEQDVAVIKYAVKTLGLPENLKLSVHSGSDKFSIYPAIQQVLKKFDAGIHVKTAGTTWLEEVIGLALSEGTGLEVAKKIYQGSLGRYDELTAPYASVLNINRSRLPSETEVMSWDSNQFAGALIHDQQCNLYNPDFRQLIHVGYKIAAEIGEQYTKALDEHRTEIEKNVKYNLLERHLKRLFL
jgi:tagaturonate epimerase